MFHMPVMTSIASIILDSNTQTFFSMEINGGWLKRFCQFFKTFLKHATINLMKKRDVLAVVAILFFLVSPSLAFYVVPSMKRLPADLDESVSYDGRLGMLDQTTYKLSYSDISIQRHITALREEDGVLILREDIEATVKGTGEKIPELCGTYIWGVDPYTVENVAGYGDLDRIGKWVFPIGVSKKDYLVWNQDLDDACKHGYVTPEEAAAVGKYMGEEKRAGMKTYKFFGGQENVFIGYFPELPEAPMYYSGELTAWVDPITGAIVDLQKHVSQYVEFPDLHKLPSNLNVSAVLVGKVTILNTTSAQYETYNATVSNNVAVENATDDYYLVRTTTIAEDEHGHTIPELCSSSLDAVNPYTMEYVAMLSDKVGRLTFPVGVKKEDYWLWDDSVGDAVRTQYAGETEIMGLPLYIYTAEVEHRYLYSEEIPGFSDRKADVYYTGITTYYVEPSTGSIAYVEKEGTATTIFPNLRSIPEDTSEMLHLEGKLSLISQPSRDIRMDRAVSVENVYWEGDKKVLLIKDDTVAYDRNTGEVIDLASGVQYHGVYADTAMEAPNYGDMARSGLFTFPVGVEKRTYEMWNTEIDAPSPVEFIREEDHNGVHTYLFETRESRMITYEGLGMPLPVKYTTDTKYWVEPTTGSLVDMYKESSMKLNPLSLVTGVPGLIWIPIMDLTLQFTPEMQEAAAEAALTTMQLLALSGKEVPALQVNLTSSDIIEGVKGAEQTKRQIAALSGNRVKVADLTYWMTDRSVDEMAATAKETAFLLLFMQIIIPAFLIVVGLIMIALWSRR